MPNITQYTNPDTTIDTQGFSQAARRIGAFATQEASTVQEQGRALGQGIERGANEVAKTVNDHIEYWDKTRVSTQATAGLADIEQKWQTLLKGTPDPNNPGKFVPGQEPADITDPDVAKRFQRDQVEPFLSDLQKTPMGLAGANYAEAKASEIRQHLSTSFAADMSTQAGKAIVLSDQRTTDNLSALVAAKPSTTNVDMAIKQLNDLSATHAGVGTLTADMAATLKAHNEENIRQVVHTAIVSAIQQPGVDPEKVASAFVDKYKDYVKPAEELQLARAAKNQIKFNSSLDRAAEAQAREHAKLQWDNAADKLHMSIVNPDGTLKVAGPEYFTALKDAVQANTSYNKDGTIKYAPPQGETSALLQFGQNHDGEDKTYTNPAAYKSAANGIIDGSMTEIDIIKMNNNGLLSDKNTARLLQNAKIVADIGVHDEGVKVAMHAADAALTYSMPGIPGKDPKGAIAYSNFINDFLPAYAAAVKKHDLPPNALDFSDPTSMASMYLKNWQRTPSQMLADRKAELGAIGGQSAFDQAKNAGTLERNTKTGQLRDRNTGKVYNPDGTEAK